MFFLLRTAFWLSLVILLIPTGSGSDEGERPELSTLQALGAAQQTYTDMTRFCERNEAACATGGAALEIFSAKARSGARMIYEYLDPADATATGSIANARGASHGANNGAMHGSTAAGPVAAPVAPAHGRDTLTAGDRVPAWTPSKVPPLPRTKPA